MDWKNQLTKTPYLVLFVILAGTSIGAIYATSTFQPGGNNINGSSPLEVIDGDLTIARTDGNATKNILRNSGENIQFTFFNTADNSVWVMRLTPDAETFQIRNNFDVSEGLFLKNDTGNVGVGTTTPSEKLDVNGNIHLSGINATITADGDICIGAC